MRIDLRQGVFGKHAVLFFAYQQPDGWFLVGRIEQIINHCHISSKLANVGEVKFGCFHLNNAIAMQGLFFD